MQNHAPWATSSPLSGCSPTPPRRCVASWTFSSSSTSCSSSPTSSRRGSGFPTRRLLNRLQRFLYDVCEPYLRIFRRILPPLGPIDLSPIVAVIVLFVIQQLLDALIERLLVGRGGTMPITPVEIRHLQLKRGFLGYKRPVVERALDRDRRQLRGRLAPARRSRRPHRGARGRGHAPRRARDPAAFDARLGRAGRPGRQGAGAPRGGADRHRGARGGAHGPPRRDRRQGAPPPRHPSHPGTAPQRARRSGRGARGREPRARAPAGASGPGAGRRNHSPSEHEPEIRRLAG